MSKEYSGTVTAAMEAIIWDVPALAFSLGTNETHPQPLDYSMAAEIARNIQREPNLKKQYDSSDGRAVLGNME